MHVDSYFVCATPRTGSSLLLGLLASSGCAGRPQAYFRAPDEPLWASRWQLPRNGYPYTDFVAAALAAGRTTNGVFGAKLMWGTVGEVTARLAAAYPGAADGTADGAADGAADGQTPGREIALLRRAFGRVAFVHLSRQDVLAQAVSWVRAEQTQEWFAGGDAEISGNRPTGARPVFDATAIEHHLHLIQEHQQCWENWFTANHVPAPGDVRGTVRRPHRHHRAGPAGPGHRGTGQAAHRPAPAPGRPPEPGMDHPLPVPSPFPGPGPAYARLPG